MKTIYRTYIDYTQEEERVIDLEISYSISPYRAATWDDPEECGTLDDCEVKIILVDDFEPTDEVAKKIMDEIDFKLIEEWIWDDYRKSKEKDEIDWLNGGRKDERIL